MKKYGLPSMLLAVCFLLTFQANSSNVIFRVQQDNSYFISPADSPVGYFPFLLATCLALTA
jgi:hypothetical protein